MQYLPRMQTQQCRFGWINSTFNKRQRLSYCIRINSYVWEYNLFHVLFVLYSKRFFLKLNYIYLTSIAPPLSFINTSWNINKCCVALVSCNWCSLKIYADFFTSLLMQWKWWCIKYFNQIHVCCLYKQNRDGSCSRTYLCSLSTLANEVRISSKRRYPTLRKGTLLLPK